MPKHWHISTRPSISFWIHIKAIAIKAVQSKPNQLTQDGSPTSQIVVQEKISNEPIAIIGLGCRFPKASSVSDFWNNLKLGKSSIVEVPKQRWNSALFWDPDPKIPDKSYAKIGGFLTDFTFNSKAFRIPPRVAGHIDPVQQIALESVAEALEDANYTKGQDFVATVLQSFSAARWEANCQTTTPCVQLQKPRTSHQSTGRELSVQNNQISRCREVPCRTSRH